MNRRRFLSTLCATGALTLAGCISNDDGGGAANQTDESTPTETPSPVATDERSDTPDATDGAKGETATDTPDERTDAAAVNSRSFDVTSNQCGQQTDSASVSFDDSPGAVSVSGTIWASDLTYTAVLESVTLDQGELSITVAAEQSSETAVGGQCIAEIAYEASVAIEGDLPSTVSVYHRRGDQRTRVTTVTR